MYKCTQHWEVENATKEFLRVYEIIKFIEHTLENDLVQVSLIAFLSITLLMKYTSVLCTNVQRSAMYLYSKYVLVLYHTIALEFQT